MKKLALLLFLPFASIAQDAAPETETTTTPVRNNELSVQVGALVELGSRNYFFNDISSSMSISYLNNFKSLQVGVGVEGGYSVSRTMYLAPSVVFNNLIRSGSSYFYIGGNAGYYYAKDVGRFGIGEEEDGYQLGGQAGFVTPISKRLSFSAELAFRSIQVWYDQYTYIHDMSGWGEDKSGYHYIRTKDFYVRVPVTIGLRYKF